MASFPDLIILRLTANPQKGELAGVQLIPPGSVLRLLHVVVVGTAGTAYMLRIYEKTNKLALPNAESMNAGVSGPGIYVPLQVGGNTFWEPNMEILLGRVEQIPATLEFAVSDQTGAAATFTEIIVSMDVTAENANAMR